MATNFLVNGKAATTDAPRFSQVSWPGSRFRSYSSFSTALSSTGYCWAQRGYLVNAQVTDCCRGVTFRAGLLLQRSV
jgi:hypothetical protein